eukprot:2675564-Prymnesium_polylepis.1
MFALRGHRTQEVLRIVVHGDDTIGEPRVRQERHCHIEGSNQRLSGQKQRQMPPCGLGFDPGWRTLDCVPHRLRIDAV